MPRPTVAYFVSHETVVTEYPSIAAALVNMPFSRKHVMQMIETGEEAFGYSIRKAHASVQPVREPKLPVNVQIGIVPELLEKVRQQATVEGIPYRRALVALLEDAIVRHFAENGETEIKIEIDAQQQAA